MQGFAAGLMLSISLLDLAHNAINSIGFLKGNLWVSHVLQSSSEFIAEPGSSQWIGYFLFIWLETVNIGIFSATATWAIPHGSDPWLRRRILIHSDSNASLL